MHDRRTRLDVLLLRDPHVLESGERGQHRTTDPGRVLPVRWGNDFDLHGSRREGIDLLLHAVGDAREHGGTARQHDVGLQVLVDCGVALHDRVVGGLVYAARLLHAQQRGLKQGLGAAESLVAHTNHLTVGQLVGLLQGGARGGGGHLLLKVQRHVAQLLLDVSADLALGRGHEQVATLGQDPHQVK